MTTNMRYGLAIWPSDVKRRREGKIKPWEGVGMWIVHVDKDGGRDAAVTKDNESMRKSRNGPDFHDHKERKQRQR